jgi:cell shape-determining protein MreC
MALTKEHLDKFENTIIQMENTIDEANKVKAEIEKLKHELAKINRKRDKLEELAKELGEVEHIWLNVPFEERHVAKMVFKCSWCAMRKQWGIDLYRFYVSSKAIPKHWL